uniref:Uncharacterized protein n=1 Tax=Lactuca sativa TaxID=4236 RepID=A0A9R1WLC2_LACSA|nr:hypothetical protein LSAT_V11C100036780 [Lactuca sativa]
MKNGRESLYKIVRTEENNFIQVHMGVNPIPKNAIGKVNYIEGWKKSHYKEGRGWCNIRLNILIVDCYYRYVEILDLLFLLIIVGQFKIENEYKKILDKVGGDESKVKQLECLARVLGERRGVEK